ncbi:uncharacterized protein LOC116218434 isoform X3 [Clupea harengus]|uniref:Uncharacterized protein LOC116218434 isoform X3 n=1 Tax=Clupea harengus TaxID=7950 RepID=A0A6P8EJ19_CLUHA|nr:uncharacterized protein LOC116218434 isoform X3 [Clupea harengus]
MFPGSVQLGGELIFILLMSTVSAEEHAVKEDETCRTACGEVEHQHAVRRTFRYSTTASSTLQTQSNMGSQLSLDCVVDIDVFPNCPMMMMKLRNPQMKRSSSQRENTVLRLKSARESLEKNPLWFSLQEGKVTALCPQEGEQVWALNIKRAILSMLQTSHSVGTRVMVEETDVYGTCMSRYERRGSVLVKARSLQQCHQRRMSEFWQHSVALKENNVISMKHECVQHLRKNTMEKVNCTETVSLLATSGLPGVVQIKTVSVLILLRTLDNIPLGFDKRRSRYLTDLIFEDAIDAKAQKSAVQEVIATVRRLCTQMTDQQQQSDQLLNLVVQLRALSLRQLKEVWQEASFKCRDDWQPLMDGLLTCASEGCILLLSELFLTQEIDQDQSSSLFSALAFAHNPSPAMIASINTLLQATEAQPKLLLAGSALVHRLCQAEQTQCNQIPEVQQYMQALKNSLREAYRAKDPTRMLLVMKAVGNSGLAAVDLIPQLNDCILNHSAPLELRLAAIQAFRRIPCHANRKVLILAYQSSQEDVEVRIAAYQQLMCCANQEIFAVIRSTLERETSSQVGSFVWSHLTQIQKTEDPLKQALLKSLPDDIISKNFESEPWKYSSFMDSTIDTGPGAANIEGALVFSPKSFIPRSFMTNLTVQIFGRAFNLMEINFRAENMEPWLMGLLRGQSAHPRRTPSPQEPREASARRRRTTVNTAGSESQGHDRERKRDECKAQTDSLLKHAKAQFAGQRSTDKMPSCWFSMKVFGNELDLLTCNDFSDRIEKLSLTAAEIALKLLKGHEVKLHHRFFVLSEELALPSLSGLPIKLGINVSSLFSLRLKGNVHFKDWFNFLLAGHIKPNTLIGISARMGVDGALGQVGLEWSSKFKSSASLNGSVQLHNGQAVKVILNTPDESMDLLSFSSGMFRVSGDVREELTSARNRMEKTTCSPKTWSKMIGWQLCYDLSHPQSAMGRAFLYHGPTNLSLRLVKLDKGLHQYLLEAVYTSLPPRDTRLPHEVHLLLSLRMPQSSVPRDIGLEFLLSHQRLLLKITHPQKNILIQGQLDHVKSTYTAKLELLMDHVYHYYLKGLMETLSLPTEKRQQYRLEAKGTAHGRPIILSVDIAQGLDRRISVTAMLKNIFKDTASFSVQLDHRQDSGQRQYSVEAEVLLPGLLGGRILGLLEHRGPQWSSALRLKYGLQQEARELRQECHVSQSLRSEMVPTQTYHMRTEHELHCTHDPSLNHKIQLRHERSGSHILSSVNLSYGKHWDQTANKHRIILSQSLRNQSRHSLTSYALEVSLQVPDRNMNYRAQLLHSRLQGKKAEGRTHLKVNYNDLMPFVAGLHWKELISKVSLRKYEGAFNMDTPWLYVSCAHKLSQLKRGTVEFSSELTTRKLLNTQSLVLEGLYKDRKGEKEARLHLFTPTVTYLKAGAHGVLGKRGLRASCSFSSAWTEAVQGQISLSDASRQLKTLELSVACGRHNLNLSTSLSSTDKQLKKRHVTLKMKLSELKGIDTELEMEGGLEELRRDSWMYQKRAMLRVRQPFQFLPESLLLQETFTVDLEKGTYVLESKALLHNDKQLTHTLTMGYKSQKPFICSSLVHPFSSDAIPQDSEMCFTLGHGQLHRELQGKFRVQKRDMLFVQGKVQFSEPHSAQQRVTLRANLTHQLQVQMPASLSVEGAVSWIHMNNSRFDYLAKGKAVINHQVCQCSVLLNGSSEEIGLSANIRHPFVCRVPKTLQAYVTAGISPAGSVSGSMGVRTDGKSQASLEVLLANSVQGTMRSMGVHVGLQQTLLPTASSSLHLQLATNVSTDSEPLQAQWTGALAHSPGVGVSGKGDSKRSMLGLSALPKNLGLEGKIISHPAGLIEGELKLLVNKGLHSLEFKHREDAKGDQEEEEGMLGKRKNGTRDWLCVRSADKHVCVNMTSHSSHQEGGSIDGQLSHSFPWLRSSGVPKDSSAGVSWAWGEERTLVDVRFHAGTRGLLVRMRKERINSTDVTRHFQVNCTGGIASDHLLGQCSGQAVGQTLEVEIWTNLTGLPVPVESGPNQLQAVSVRGHWIPTCKKLVLSFANNISALQPYLPARFFCRSQFNHTWSVVRGAAKLLTDKRMFTAQGDFTYTAAGFRQSLELNHTFPQLMFVPRTATVSTLYERGNCTHVLQHQADWTSMDLTPSGSTTVNPAQGFPLPHGWGLGVKLDGAPQRRLVDLLLGWTAQGKHKRVEAVGSWVTEGARSQGAVELRQPFTSIFSHLRLHAHSQKPMNEPHSTYQAMFSWDKGRPVNVSITTSQHSQESSSRGQACFFFSPGQLQTELPLVKMQGCMAAAWEGPSYTQNTDLQWSDKRITQSMKYQIGPKAMHTLQVEVGAENVSPSPCPTHHLLAQIHTNCRDTLEHHLLLGLCPPRPALAWSGSHRLNRGKEVFYSQTRLAVSGQLQLSSFTLALTNTSTTQRTNFSMLTEWQMGNWSLEVGGSAVSSGRGPGLRLQAKLDGAERVWVQGGMEKRCLRAGVGYEDGPHSLDDVTMGLCLEGRYYATLEALRFLGGVKREILALVSLSAANQSLAFSAKGCAECLADLETRSLHVGSRIRNKLLDRVQRMQHHLMDFRRKSVDSSFLQELSSGPLHLIQRAEVMLHQKAGLTWAAWRSGSLRRSLTETLPHTLLLLHHTAQLVQQELHKPLATLAGAYHDVTGQRLEALWREAVALWGRRLTELLPAVLEDPQLRGPAQAALHSLTIALDMACHQAVHWAEARLAAALIGAKRQLASVYKLSHSDYEVRLRLLLPRGSWRRLSQAGVTEVLLEELMVRPLMALSSLSPSAELYHLKRRLMDSPFNHQAVLVADEFVVSFDGHLYEVPASCGLMLASDASGDSFRVLLSPGVKSQRALLVKMKNTSVTIYSNGEVQVDCRVTHPPYKYNGVIIQRDINLTKVSNERGLQVSCDPLQNVCTVTLDGWLHGVSTGLLGTNDNEAANDFTRPDGSQAADLAEFSQSWQLEPQCPNEAPEKVCLCRNMTSDLSGCSALFSSPDSPLSSCFLVVDPVQFLTVCERSVCQSLEPSRSTPCKLATAYVLLCRRNYVPLEPPAPCA